MNKTQKLAWFGVLSYLLTIAIGVYIGVRIFLLKTLPEGFLGRCCPIIAVYGLVALSIVLIRRKQSRLEPDSDERDELIKKRAAQISLISAGLLLAVATLVPALILGEGGSIPVYLLTLSNLGVFLTGMLIYSVAVLVQYAWRNGGDKS